MFSLFSRRGSQDSVCDPPQITQISRGRKGFLVSRVWCSFFTVCVRQAWVQYLCVPVPLYSPPDFVYSKVAERVERSTVYLYLVGLPPPINIVCPSVTTRRLTSVCPCYPGFRLYLHVSLFPLLSSSWSRVSCFVSWLRVFDLLWASVFSGFPWV